MLDRFEQFSGCISAIYRSIRKLERDEMVKYGLKGTYAHYLMVMHRFKNGITAAQLGEICDKDKAAVSRIVSDMEKKGLVKRQEPNNNRYRALIVLTDEGKKAAQYVSKRAKIAVEKAGSGLDDIRRAEFYTAMGIISSNLQDICKDGIPDKI